MNAQTKSVGGVAVDVSWGASAPPSAPTEDEKLWGMLVNILGLFFVIGPLMAWLVKGTSNFVKFNAAQMLLVQAVLFALGVALGVCWQMLSALGGLIYPLYGLLQLAFLICLVVLALKAKSGMLFRLPVLGAFAHKFIYGAAK